MKKALMIIVMVGIIAITGSLIYNETEKKPNIFRSLLSK
jgi:uncharacterized protein YxeA